MYAEQSNPFGLESIQEMDLFCPAKYNKVQLDVAIRAAHSGTHIAAEQYIKQK